MDERILALLGSFAEIGRELGADVLDSAIERARLAVAAEVMVEAERRSLRARKESSRHSVDGNVITLRGGNGARTAHAGICDAE